MEVSKEYLKSMSEYLFTHVFKDCSIYAKDGRITGKTDSGNCVYLFFHSLPFFFLSLSTYEYFSGFCPCLIHLFIYFSLPQRYESCSGPGIRLGIGHLLLTRLPRTSTTLTAITVASQRTTQVCFQCWLF